jgi:hypothetical protein
MKRIMIVTAALVFMVSGLAFSGENAGAGKDGKARLYNGITYFETGAEPDCASPSSTAENTGNVQADGKNFNGITFFDTALTGTGANGKCAGSSSILASAKKTFNGITVF